jgi:hypothetical protein
MLMEAKIAARADCDRPHSTGSRLSRATIRRFSAVEDIFFRRDAASSSWSDFNSRASPAGGVDDGGSAWVNCS